MTQYNIGVDISKSHLDVHRLEDQKAKQFDNNSEGFLQFIDWLKDHDVARIVFEPTGPYHGAFERAFGERFPLVKVNPLQARRFAQACGIRAKTDAVDARILAKMGATLGLEPQKPQDDITIILKEMHVARASLIKERTRLKNRAQVQNIALIKDQIDKRLELVLEQIQALDQAISQNISKQKKIARSCEILTSIPGIQTVTAAAILTFLPEIGKLERRQTASLAGLAPITRQSGKWQGKSFISGGRKPLRDALYMPALVAMRFNPDMKVKYEELRAAGKPAKVAIVAIMRRLIELANILVKNDRFWVKKGVD